jgi:pyruvate formate lyase activating enzyme
MGIFIRWFTIGFLRQIQIPSKKNPLETLEKAYKIAKDLGMDYVYLGNTDQRNNTYCPKCGKLLIERWGMTVVENKVKDGKCPYCGAEINLGGRKWIE